MARTCIWDERALQDPGLDARGLYNFTPVYYLYIELLSVLDTVTLVSRNQTQLPVKFLACQQPADLRNGKSAKTAGIRGESYRTQDHRSFNLTKLSNIEIRCKCS